MTLAFQHSLASFPTGGTAVVIGATGGLGAALLDHLSRASYFEQVVGLSRSVENSIDITDENSVANVAERFANCDIRLIIVASGLLLGQGIAPEKSWRDVGAAALAHSFAVNTIGPALIFKHFLPMLPRSGKAVCAVLSARVGSIEDNKLGGWYGYRAAKAALNQIMRTASVELARSRPEAICVALHPGTVATPLSSPFIKSGLEIQQPDAAASRLLTVIDGLKPTDTGGFFDHQGNAIPF
jgi:NAD(P)-dependent dehydrogenase (short-subunit alcohol dehydrogenase family)